ncbi:MAG: hypothetical protein Q9218_003545 [Villophora microphyllina]
MSFSIHYLSFRIFIVASLLLCFSLLGNVVQARPSNLNTYIPAISNITTNQLDAEFSGLAIGYYRYRSGSNIFTIEQMALTAIAAMKEEALKDYFGFVREFNFFDDQQPENPVYWMLRSSPASRTADLKRSNIMWTLMTLIIQLMQYQLYRVMPFHVTRYQVPVYDGFILNRNAPIHPVVATAGDDNSTLTARALTNSPHSLTATPQNSTSMILHPTTSAFTLKNDFPHLTLDFTFPGSPLSKYGIFESLLEFLLVLGKIDATAERPRLAIMLPRLQVYIYLIEAYPAAPEHPLQQYLSVAILEAMARYFVLRGEWREMTVVLKADEMVVARGCVTAAVRTRFWCRGMFWEEWRLPPVTRDDVIVRG